MRRAVVTGAASGIGAATAAHLTGAGVEVAAFDVDADGLDRLRERGHANRTYVCDVSAPEAMAATATAVLTDLGPVDLLVNNAGVGVSGPFAGPAEDWDWLQSINVGGVVNGCRAFGPGMLARGTGHVVNVSSGMAWAPNRQMAAYCTSKAAVLMLSRCLRAEWRAHGVGVSVICPGVINTPIKAASRVNDLDPRRDKLISWAFRHGHDPSRVARAIDRAWAKNLAIVPVGPEAHLARFTPGPILDRLAQL